jgi:hypothetical protein
MKYQKFIFLFIIAAFIDSCGQVSAEKDSAKTKSDSLVVKVDSSTKASKAAPIITAPMFHEIASILGGIEDSSNVLSYLYDTAAWNTNKKFINDNWKKIENTRLHKMSNWRDKEISAPNKNCTTVFYPFSGPDFLTAYTFFPNAEKIIMLGLEPIGSLPNIYKFNNASALDYSQDFQKSLTDIFQKSYFITSYMLRDFQQEKVNGLLPVLSFFITKTGHKITDIKFLNKNGNAGIVEQPYNAKVRPMGVKITCTKNNITKTVYYFKYDVSNQYFNDSTVFYKFINDNTKKSVTYIKSASYLLHANFMSNMKKLILRNSNYVLEDDTGIPFNDIEKTKEWDIKLYGKYSKPVKDFPYLQLQTGIVNAFQTDSMNIPDLPFHLGYHWALKKDLLIYSIKKNPIK